MKIRNWTFLYWLAVVALIVICLDLVIFAWRVFAAEPHGRTPLPRQVKVSEVLLNQTITAYTSSYEETAGNPYVMADGTRVYFGAAACPYNLKFGTQFRIRGMFDSNTFTCHDRSIYREGVFDLWVTSKNEAYDIGRKSVDIEILK